MAVGSAVEQDLHQEFIDENVSVVGVEMWNSGTPDVQSFVDETGATFTIALDGGQTARAYDVPKNWFVVIDGEGTVRFVDGFGSSVNYTELNQMMTNIADEVRGLLGPSGETLSWERAEAPLRLALSRTGVSLTPPRPGTYSLALMEHSGRMQTMLFRGRLSGGVRTFLLPGDRSRVSVPMLLVLSDGTRFWSVRLP